MFVVEFKSLGYTVILLIGGRGYQIGWSKELKAYHKAKSPKRNSIGLMYYSLVSMETGANQKSRFLQ